MMGNLEKQYVEARAAAKLYAEAETDLIKLKFARKSARLFSSFASASITLLFGAVSLMVLLISVGFALGNFLDSVPLGFLCAGICGLIFTAIVAVGAKKVLEKPIIKSVLKEF